MTNGPPPRAGSGRWPKFALIVLAVILLFLLFWPVLAWWARAAVFSHIVDGIGQWTHWNTRVVTGVVILLILPLFWALSHLIRLRLPAFREASRRSRGRLQLLAYMCVVLYAAAFYLVTGIASRDIYFGRDGEPLKYCIESVDGLYCEDSPGYDPDGSPLVPVTRDMVARHRQRTSGRVPERLRLRSLEEFDGTTFVAPDGRPRVWMARSLAGEVEYFDSPGFHPVTGEKLVPVTTEGLRGLRAELEEASARAEEQERQDELAHADREKRAAAEMEAARVAQFIDPRVRALGGPAALVVSEGGEVCGECMDALREQLRADQALFRPAFITGGYFARASAGDRRALGEVGLDQYPSFILLAQETSLVTEDRLEAALRTVATSYVGYVFAKTGLRPIRATGTASDFNELRARDKARRAAISNLIAAAESRH